MSRIQDWSGLEAVSTGPRDAVGVLADHWHAIPPKPKPPRKPRLVYPPDLLRWFEVLEEFPDRLPVVCDWLEENEAASPAHAMLLPAVLFARDKGRWPGRVETMHPTASPTLRVGYSWLITRYAVIETLTDVSWLSTSNHKIKLTDAKIKAVRARAVNYRRSRNVSRQANRYTTRPVKLIDSFRYLSILIGDQS